MDGALRITQSGVDQTIHLGEVDITHALRSITLKVEAGCLPVAELDVAVFDVTAATDNGTVLLVPEPTRGALVALGWTPPEGG